MTGQEPGAAGRPLFRLKSDEASEGAVTAPKVVRVLLAEDNPGDSVLVRDMLKQVETARHEVEWVTSVDQALAVLARQEHDVALVDYSLGDGTALDILRQADLERWTAPIVVLTGTDDPEVDDHALKTGAHDFLRKDELRPAILDHSIRYAIEKKRAEVALFEKNLQLQRIVEALRLAKRESELRGHSIVSLAHHLASDGLGDSRAAPSDRKRPQNKHVGLARDLGIWRFTAEGRTIDANAPMLELFEVGDVDDLLDRRFCALFTDESKRQLEAMLPGWSRDAAQTIELEIVGQTSGKQGWIVMSGMALEDGVHERIYQATVVDITERKVNEEATRYRARHDALTGLANRPTLTESLRHAIAISKRSDKLLALLCIDLNGFKAVNDTYTHRAGDILLREVAVRLTATVRASDTVARFGGDEFVVVATNLESPQDASVLAAKIVEMLSEPYVIRGQTIACSASVGIALCPDDAAEPEQLTEFADLALCRVKQSDARKWQFFDCAMNRKLTARREMEGRLREALNHNGFEMTYQPLFDLEQESVTGLEALLRWRPLSALAMATKDLVSGAEETGLIGSIGAWVLDTSCMAIASWTQGVGRLSLVVNVSPAQLRDPSFVGQVESALRGSGLDPQRLRLDITGRPAARDLKAAARCLAHLQELGVRLTLDGIGRPEDGLVDLQNLPFDQIKIDRALMIGALDSEREEAFARALVHLGRVLGLSIAAKGVERERELDFVRTLGCDQVQGRHLCPPLALLDLPDQLRRLGLRGPSRALA